MKWFKHLVDSGDDPNIDDSFTLFGPAGPYVFFRTLEVMSREFDIHNPGKNEFSVEFLRKKYRVSWQKTLKILKFFDERGRIFLAFPNSERLPAISLYCPKLEHLTDEYTQKQLKALSGQTPNSSRDKLRPKEEEEEEDKRNKRSFVETSNEFRLSKQLFELIKNRKSTFKKPNLQKWAEQIDLMIRLDKREPSVIEAVIEWCQQDEFWQNNILSTQKLRKQFDQLELKMNQDNGDGEPPYTEEFKAVLRERGEL